MKRAIYSGELRIGSLILKVHTLEDGTRIIEEQSVIDFIEWLGKGEEITPEMQKQLQEIAKFCKK